MIEQLKCIYHKLREHCWGIGFIEDTPQNVLNSAQPPHIKWVKNPYKDRWFADPFILYSDDKSIELLVEEFSYKHRRGRIARLVVDRETMTITDFKIILELDTHLSFPFIIRKDGEVLVVPENYKSGIQSLFKYNADTCKLELQSTLSPGKFTDAVIFKAGGIWQMISTEEPNPNGSDLEYFILDNNLNIEYKKDQFHFDGRTARNGGDIFRIRKKAYRPAQICDHRYGEGIELQEVVIKDDKIVGFKPIKRILPTCKRWHLGIHTFNISPDDSNLIVIDGHGYRYPLIGSLIEKLARAKRKILK